jgi:DNA-binding LytR/AlgR family response regulator
MPAVVFVTAYDQYTIKAFDVYAVDYLLKPFSEERFHQAAARVRERLSRASNEDLNQQIKNLLSHLKTNSDFLDRLVINHKDRLIVISVKEVDSVTAYGNYLKVHTKEKPTCCATRSATFRNDSTLKFSCVFTAQRSLTPNASKNSSQCSAGNIRSFSKTVRNSF